MKKVIILSILILIMFCGSCKKESEIIINQAKKEAEVIVSQAKEESNAIINEANAILNTANGFILKEEKKLYKLYPDLKEYRVENLVSQEYLDSFRVDGRDVDGRDKIRVTLINNSGMEVQPSFHIIFFDKYGFKVGDCSIHWFWNRIKPGETRFDEGVVSLYEKPCYYRIEL